MNYFLLAVVLGSLTIQPQDLTIARDQVAGFECHAPNSIPRTNVSWYRGSDRLQNSDRVLISSETGALFIRDATPNDNGRYHCVLENLAGSVTSRNAQLTVTNTFTAGGKCYTTYVA